MLHVRLSLKISAGVAMTIAGFATAPPAMSQTPVTVTNPKTNPALVRNVDRPATQAFAAQLCAGSSSSNPCYINISPTPPSMIYAPTSFHGAPVERLVIEYVSGICSDTGPGQLIEISLGTATGGASIWNFFVPTVQPHLNGSVLVWAQPTRIYANPGAPVIFGPLIGIADTYRCTFSINGYLEMQ